MADLTRQELQELARIGAKSRLDALRREEASIRRAFPDLFVGRGRRGPGTAVSAATAESAAPPAAAGRVRRRSTMSAEARKAASERMTKYWAERRKANAK